MCVPVSQVISDTELRTTVFLDLRLPVSPRPSDTVTLWRDGEETREGGRDKRNRWNLPALTPSPPFDCPISQYQSINTTLCIFWIPFCSVLSLSLLAPIIWLLLFLIFLRLWDSSISLIYHSISLPSTPVSISLFFLLFHEYFLKSIPSFPFTYCFILESIVSLESVFSLGACFTTFNIKVAHKKTFYFNL